ncbi:MAG TPA: GNAT family N-acetyltransferase [Pyrinomonadaceae bacterium]|nr:GNAT family N-acetyltransferase [Pyrinomonadaceae bacterium]
MFGIESIAPTRKTRRFDCGEATLNNFLKQFALKNALRDIGRTYVAVPQGSANVVGYYTISSGTVRFDQLPSDLKFPKYPIPTAHIGRLATDLSVRGQGLGEALLFDALITAEAASRAIGIRVVELIALSESAKAFYMRYGFTPLVDDSFRLYLSMETVRLVVGGR